MQRLGDSVSWRSNFCFHYNYYSDGSLQADCGNGLPQLGTSGNSGDLLGFVFKDNTGSPSPDMDHTVNLTYNPLDRLATSVATGSQTHNLTFYQTSPADGYDRYGNAKCVTTGQTSGPCANWSFNTATNQINSSGFSHDGGWPTLQIERVPHPCAFGKGGELSHGGRTRKHRG